MLWHCVNMGEGTMPEQAVCSPLVIWFPEAPWTALLSCGLESF